MATVENKNYLEVRSKIAPHLDRSLFKRNPALGIISIGIFCLYWGFFYFGYSHPYWILPVGFCMGVIGEFLSIANHDILHGLVFRSQSLSLLTCIPNSLITLISPSFWKFWHNFHHQSVDRWTSDKRPYEMGTESHGYPLLRKWLGPLELCLFKVFHLTRVQIRFLMDSKYKSRNHLSLKRNVAIQFALIVIFKFALFVILPFKLWLGLELFPLAVQGILSGIFLVTQHAYKLDKPGCIRTFTLRLPGWMEALFLNVGFHVEHHLFPNIPSRHLPLIRQKLLEHNYQGKAEYSMKAALIKVYDRSGEDW